MRAGRGRKEGSLGAKQTAAPFTAEGQPNLVQGGSFSIAFSKWRRAGAVWGKATAVRTDTARTGDPLARPQGGTAGVCLSGGWGGPLRAGEMREDQAGQPGCRETVRVPWSGDADLQQVSIQTTLERQGWPAPRRPGQVPSQHQAEAVPVTTTSSRP